MHTLAMSIVIELAQFNNNASYDMMSAEAVTALKIRLLDTLGCAIDAMLLKIDIREKEEYSAKFPEEKLRRLQY